MQPTQIFTNPLHLGSGASAVIQPPMTVADWYAAYEDRTAADGKEGRLVSAFRFTESWDAWERHPAGEEVVLCLEGEMTLHQEQADGTVATVKLSAGDYIVNPAGIWHTADVEGVASALFITPGAGTEHRPR